VISVAIIAAFKPSETTLDHDRRGQQTSARGIDVTRTTQPRIDSAIARVDEELSVLGNEREAFEAFRARLVDLEPAVPTGGVVDRPTADRILIGRAAEKSCGGESLDAVRSAYRDTVMSVDHYDSDYGDSLHDSVAVELGIDVADRVVDGDVLDPLLWRELLSATRRVLADRERMITAVERERRSLVGCREDLDAIEGTIIEVTEERTVDATDDPSAGVEPSVRATLVDLEHQCEAVARRRQELIHDRSVVALSGVDEDGLVTYLYGDRTTSFPVLTDCLECLATIRYHREARPQRPD